MFKQKCEKASKKRHVSQMTKKKEIKKFLATTKSRHLRSQNINCFTLKTMDLPEAKRAAWGNETRRVLGKKV